MAYSRVPMREIIGLASPIHVTKFGDMIAKKLENDDKAKRAGRERSGKLSGGKMRKPTLWNVLDLIGVPDEDFESYLLGKFMRGNDVEARAINLLTGISMARLYKLMEEDSTEPIRFKAPKGAVLNGEFTLQKKSGYRGGVGYIDITQHTLDGDIYHEIKSSTKMAYDKVAASGRSAKKKQPDGSYAVGKPEPYYHHCLQLAYYCLGDKIDRGFVHYFNADDYRLTSFSINPLDYKEELDKEIDDVDSVFLSKVMPAFEGYLDFHKIKDYWSYKVWNELTPQQMLDKLERSFPDQYKKLMETDLTKENK